MKRLSTGTRLESSGSDAGSLSQEAKARLEKISHNTYRNNLQNARSFLFAQEQSLLKVKDVFERMENLAIHATAPTTSNIERADYEIEYQSLSNELSDLMGQKFNGKALFSDTLLCGGYKNIPLQELDLVSDTGKAGASHAVRSQTADTGSPSGSIKLRVNSGSAGDIYRVWMGDICIFSAGPAFPSSLDQTKQYNDNFKGAYDPTVNYTKNDLIKASNGSYLLAYRNVTSADPVDPNDVSNVISYSDSTNLANWRNGSTGQSYAIGDLVKRNGGIWENQTGKNPTANNRSLFEAEFEEKVWIDQELGYELEYLDAAGVATLESVNPRGGWRTSGAASSEDDDEFEIIFGPGQQTTYKVTPGRSNDDGPTTLDDVAENLGAGNGEYDIDKSLVNNIRNGATFSPATAGDNISDFNVYDSTTGKYDNIITNDLPESFDSTTMTIQVESDTIGIIYDAGGSANGDADGSGTDPIKFVPTAFNRKVSTNLKGDFIEIHAKGFGTLDQKSEVTGMHNNLLSVTQSKDIINHIRGNNDYFGELTCIVNERLGQVGAEYRRIDSEIAHLEEKIATDEFKLGRISDADMALEAIQLAKGSMKTKLAEQSIMKSTRLKDILIPLTINHFRGSVLSASL
jgi:flagellin-like hook-associated protein FlgL